MCCGGRGRTSVSGCLCLVCALPALGQVGWGSVWFHIQVVGASEGPSHGEGPLLPVIWTGGSREGGVAQLTIFWAVLLPCRDIMENSTPQVNDNTKPVLQSPNLSLYPLQLPETKNPSGRLISSFILYEIQIYNEIKSRITFTNLNETKLPGL